MFAVLLLGVYSAYKSFSGLDPLKLDFPRTPAQFTKVLSSLKIDPNILGKAVPSGSSHTPGGSKNGSLNDSLGGFDSPGVNAALFRFLLIADPHIDNGNLKKAIDQAKQQYPDLQFIIGLGDYSEVGTVAEFKEAKSVLDASALRYFLIPGDHDLWDCRNRNLVPVSCFSEVFGPDYQSFVFDEFEFLLLDNSDNYTGFNPEQLKWVAEQLERAKGAKGIFVFLHEPLYHPSSEHIMGRVEKGLKSQAGGLLFQFKDAGVKKVFAGDTHFFSEYTEPVTGLSMATIGAVTIERNAQAPRFSVVSVFEDGSTKVDDVIILGL